MRMIKINQYTIIRREKEREEERENDSTNDDKFRQQYVYSLLVLFDELVNINIIYLVWRHGHRVALTKCNTNSDVHALSRICLSMAIQVPSDDYEYES